MNRQQRNDYHHELVEHLADSDEAMGEIFLDEREPSEEEVHAAIRRATLKRAFTPVMMGTALKNKVSVQSGAGACSGGFVTCFLRVSQAVGLYCSCHAAQESKGNFQKTYYKTFGTSCRPRL